MAKIKLLLLVLICGLLASCSSSSRRPHSGAESSNGSMAGPTSAIENKDIAHLDMKYRQQDFDYILKRTKALLAVKGKTPIFDQIHFYRGLGYLGLRQYQFAIVNFKETISKTKSTELKLMAQYNQALSLHDMNASAQALVVLNDISVSSLNEGDRYKYLLLLAKIQFSLSEYLAAAESNLKAGRLRDPQSDFSKTNRPELIGLNQSLAKIESESELKSLVADFDDNPMVDSLWYRLGQLFETKHELESAKLVYARVVNDFPRGSVYLLARERLEQLNISDSGSQNHQSVSIGVILPLSGRFSSFGGRVLQSIEMALNLFSENTQGSFKGISIIPMDDEGDPTIAKIRAEELIQQHQVVAIIGPLVSKNVEVVAKVCEENKIPLISLTQREVSGYQYVFNGALTPKAQIKELVKYAVKKLGKNTFGILSPRSRFGEEYSKLFWDELELQGKDLRGFEQYPENETDFRSTIDQMFGISFVEARAQELEFLRKERDLEFQKTKKRNNKPLVLPPIMDIEAVFIPEDPKALGQILPTFAYRDVENLQFLGINTWHSTDLIARGGSYVEGAVFVDSFFEGSSLPSAVAFLQDFRTLYHADPTSLEASAYDAAKLFGTLISKGNSNKIDLFNAIMKVTSFPGVMGNIQVENGTLVKQLAILTVKGGNIEEIAQ